MFDSITNFIRDLYGNNDQISLHEPAFLGKERQYLTNCIDVGYVSTVGAYVETFEKQIAEYTGAQFAVSTVNGTAALHAAMIVTGVKPGEEVLTQALTFVATANTIAYCSAKPIFIDVDRETLGLSAKSLRSFLESSVEKSTSGAINKSTGKRIAACIPVHVFGHPLEIDSVVKVCNEYNIPVIEDAAEGMGSFYKNKHLGTFGQMGTLSFNGNKVMTTGGGGMILTNDPLIAKRVKHITTTARVPSTEYIHDEVGYNYRMPNLNAALGCAQLENLDQVIANKIETAQAYKTFFNGLNIPFIQEPKNSRSNYWLNAILLKDKNERDQFLAHAVEKKIFARPAWRAMNQLDMYKNCQTDSLITTTDICARLVNLPSSYRTRTV